MKKKSYLPKPVLKNLVSDIKKLITTNEGRLFVLEIIEEIPYEIRGCVLEGISSFYDDNLVAFFHLIKEEYGKELELVCNRALEKYRMAGMEVSSSEFFKGSFYKAYASLSRHTGRISLDVAWNIGGKGLHVECFYLTYNADGIHSFFLIEDMSWQKYENDRVLGDMVELSFEETCILLTQAYNINVRYMNRPALGKFLYNKYINNKVYSDEEIKQVTRKISCKLTPRQLVHSFFYGLKQEDYCYVSSIVNLSQPLKELLNNYFMQALTPGAIMLEARVDEVFASFSTAMVTAHMITMAENRMIECEYRFYMGKDEFSKWYIRDISMITEQKGHCSCMVDPLDCKVFCRVYEIIDIDELFDTLDKVDRIRAVDELPYGIHLRVANYEDDFNFGISFLQGIIADLVINGSEFVIMCRDYSTLMDFDDLLLCAYEVPVVSRGEYEINLITAHNYLGGQYINFEDILIEDNDLVFEDGMRFICTRYFIKDRQQIADYLYKLNNTVKRRLSDNYEVFYQLESEDKEASLFAEYILGSDWITLSTFGESDMSLARRIFETDMCDCLEFEGMEVKEEGIFAILKPEVKKACPDLEYMLKEMYLNKWFNSRLNSLSGMSPSEAAQSEEGKRLLWTMFKKIKQNKNQRYLEGKHHNINLKEYIRKVEQKMEKNQ